MEELGSFAGRAYPETVRWIEKKLTNSHPGWVEILRKDLKAARQGQEPTVFDELVNIIRDHGPGGAQAEDAVDLELA